MRNRVTTRSIAALLLMGILAVVIGAAPTAVAATTVSKSGATLTITGDAGASNIRIVRDDRRIRVFDGSTRLPIAGGRATVNNIDTIAGDLGDGADRFTIDHAGGFFAPGATPEGSGRSEIEFTITAGADAGDVTVIAGRSVADTFVIGDGGGWDVNSDGDLEMGILGASTITLNGRGGDDVIALDGPTGNCQILAIPAVVNGGEGDDALSGTSGTSSTLNGGPGDDLLLPTVCEPLGNFARTMSGGGGDDRIIGGPIADVLSGGDGKDIIRAAGGADVLSGDAGGDRLFGGGGGDQLNGGKDRDECRGEEGVDTFTKCEAQID